MEGHRRRGSHAKCLAERRSSLGAFNHDRGGVMEQRGPPRLEAIASRLEIAMRLEAIPGWEKKWPRLPRPPFRSCRWSQDRYKLPCWCSVRCVRCEQFKQMLLYVPHQYDNYCSTPIPMGTGCGLVRCRLLQALMAHKLCATSAGLKRLQPVIQIFSFKC